jgi:hypothetical protein
MPASTVVLSGEWRRRAGGLGSSAKTAKELREALTAALGLRRGDQRQTQTE